MRIIHTALYSWSRSFRFGELTVWGYSLLMQDSAAFIEYILSEFGKPPHIESDHIEALMDFLVADIPRGRGDSSSRSEWHITLAIVMRELHQWYADLMMMPMREFVRIIDDMDVITGATKLEEKRKDPIAATKEFFGGSSLKTVS